MVSEDLPRKKQEELIMLGHRLEIEAEDEKRRQCTRFGYRFGGLAGLCAALGGMVVLASVLVIVLAFVAPSLDTTSSTSLLFWCFAPIALIPILPFVFMKPRYALRQLMFIVIVFAIIGLLAGLGSLVEDAIV